MKPFLFKQRWNHFKADQAGQALVITSLCMTVLLCFVGLSIDVGRARLEKRKLQAAADAAALAAGMELRVCGSLPNCPAMQAAAQASLNENGYSNVQVITDCLTTPGTSLTLTLNDPPCNQGSKDPNAGSPRYVEAVMTEQQPTVFARFLGINHFNLGTRAEARRNPGPPCIYALDQTGAKAINLTAATASVFPCGIIDESSSPSAFYCSLSALNSIPSARVTGGIGGFLCLQNISGISTSVPRPTPNDPLAYLPKPTVGSCGTSTASPYSGSGKQVSITGLGGNYVFNPGVYCGGISISTSLAANVTFNPGTYILTQGQGGGGFLQPVTTTGGLSLQLNALTSVSGTGVTFYNLGPVGAFNLQAPTTAGSLNLSAPTSGPYSGILLFQDPANTNAATAAFSVAQGNAMNGAVYLPQATLNYGVSAVSSAYTILVAKDINFSLVTLSSLGNNYNSLASGSPLNGDATVLVQ